jgi:hypothetical protein
MCHVKKEEKKEEKGFKYTGPLRPFPQTVKGKRAVPDTIKKPDYAKTGAPNIAFQALADK